MVTGVFWGLMFLTPMVGIPVACVVAVLRYRLYDLGRVVSRTVAYAIVTGPLVGVYACLVLLAAFAARLKEELDADAVTEDLARSVRAALEPAHVSIWLSERR